MHRFGTGCTNPSHPLVETAKTRRFSNPRCIEFYRGIFDLGSASSSPGVPRGPAPPCQWPTLSEPPPTTPGPQLGQKTLTEAIFAHTAGHPPYRDSCYSFSRGRLFVHPGTEYSILPPFPGAAIRSPQWLEDTPGEKMHFGALCRFGKSQYFTMERKRYTPEVVCRGLQDRVRRLGL